MKKETIYWLVTAALIVALSVFLFSYFRSLNFDTAKTGIAKNTYYEETPTTPGSAEDICKALAMLINCLPSPKQQADAATRAGQFATISGNRGSIELTPQFVGSNTAALEGLFQLGNRFVNEASAIIENDFVTVDRRNELNAMLNAVRGAYQSQSFISYASQILNTYALCLYEMAHKWEADLREWWKANMRTHGHKSGGKEYPGNVSIVDENATNDPRWYFTYYPHIGLPDVKLTGIYNDPSQWYDDARYDAADKSNMWLFGDNKSLQAAGAMQQRIEGEAAFAYKDPQTNCQAAQAVVNYQARLLHSWFTPQTPFANDPDTFGIFGAVLFDLIGTAAPIFKPLTSIFSKLAASRF